MQRLRIVSYRVRPASSRWRNPSRVIGKRIGYDPDQVALAKTHGAEIDIYHPCQTNTILEASHDAITLMVGPNRGVSQQPAVDEIIAVDHPLVRVGTYRRTDATDPLSPEYNVVLERLNIAMIFRSLDKVQDGTMPGLQISITAEHLEYWLLRWQRHINSAITVCGHLNGRAAQTDLRLRLLDDLASGMYP